MSGISDVATEFEAFLQTIQTEREHLIKSIASLNNGFEGWLKLEFFFWLTKHRQLRASRVDAEHDVGMEYTVSLDQNHPRMDRPTKQCDLWVRDSKNNGYHFIELKAPFANTNQGKVMGEAADDFWYMSRLQKSDEEVASGNAVILGVGFEEENWHRHISNISNYSDMPTDSISIKSGYLGETSNIRWTVLTTQY